MNHLLTRLVIVALATAAVLLGCGGGSGTNHAQTLRPGLASDAIVLPADGTVLVSDITPASMRLTGSVAGLHKGSVVVNITGDGFARRVTAISDEGSSKVLTTEDAVLADVLTQGEFKVDRSVTAADIVDVSTEQGVTFQNRGRPNRSDSYPNVFTITAKKLGPVTVNGSLSFDFNLNADLVLADSKVSRFQVIPEIKSKMAITVKGDIKGVASEKVPLGTVVTRFLGPYGIPMIARWRLFADLTGTASAELSFSSSTDVTGKMGVIYEKGEWTPQYGLNVTSTIDDSPTYTDSLKLDFTPAKLEVGVYILGVLGPKLTSQIPTLEYEIQSKPEENCVESFGRSKDKAEVGIDITAWGYKDIASYTITLVDQQLKELFHEDGCQAITVEVTPSLASVNVGSTVQLTAQAKDASGKVIPLPGGSFNWITSDPSKATVDPDGKVSGKEAGTVTITATMVAGGKQASATVSVVPPDTKLDVEPKSIEAVSWGTSSTSTYAGASYQVTVNNGHPPFTWSIADGMAGSVDQNGLFTPQRHIAKSTITVTDSDGKQATVPVSVNTSDMFLSTMGDRVSVSVEDGTVSRTPDPNMVRVFVPLGRHKMTITNTSNANVTLGISFFHYLDGRTSLTFDGHLADPDNGNDIEPGKSYEVYIKR